MKIGVVVPTLGRRERFLHSSLSSIRGSAPETHIVLVSPKFDSLNLLRSEGLWDSWIEDPGKGLAASINNGLAALPDDMEFATWLGDDDLVDSGSLQAMAAELSRSNASFIYSGCRYVDENGAVLWENRSGKWASKILAFGPDLVPQPSSLFRLNDFWEVGGLDEGLGWAFDLDLFIKLRDLNGAKFLSGITASFRWHADSLTVDFRAQSVAEATQVKVRRAPTILRPAMWAFHSLVGLFVLASGKLVHVLPNIGIGKK